MCIIIVSGRTCYFKMLFNYKDKGGVYRVSTLQYSTDAPGGNVSVCSANDHLNFMQNRLCVT